MASSCRERRNLIVYRLSSQRGYSLVELLTYLGLFLTLCLVLFPVLHYLRMTTSVHLIESRLEREWNIYIQQLEREAAQAERYIIEEDRLHLDVNGRRITYELYDTIIRRRVTGEGHMVMCQFVHAVSFEQMTPKLFIVTLTLEKDGRHREGKRLIALKSVNTADERSDHRYFTQEEYDREG